MFMDMSRRRNHHPLPFNTPFEPREASSRWRKRAASLRVRVDEVKPPYALYRWVLMLRRKRVVCTLNAILFLILLGQTVNLFRFHGDVHLPDSLFATLPLDELPHPMDIVVQVRTHNIATPRNVSFYKPGYTSIRNATFRNRYPSVTLQGTGTFDEVFVITSEKCDEQFRDFEQLASEKADIPVTRWNQEEARHVSLQNPPLPVSASVRAKLRFMKKSEVSLMRKHVAYLEAHKRLWAHMAATGKQRVLVIDDTLFPTTRLLNSLPTILTNIDQESVARQQPWHFIFLRRQVPNHELRLPNSRKERIWTMNPNYKHSIVQANISHGASAYILSLDGARFLHEHVTVFRAPLDIEIGLVQRDFAGRFVALSACNNDVQTPFCPEMIEDISPNSARALKCTWRRLHERRNAQEFDGYLKG